MAFLESLGSKTIAVFHELGAVILLLTASFKEINNFRGKESIKQCFDLGVMSFPIVALTLLFTGMVPVSYTHLMYLYQTEPLSPEKWWGPIPLRIWR